MNPERGIYAGAPRTGLPFWIPASNYYLLAGFVALAVFLIVWAALYDGRDETPWIAATLSSLLFAVSMLVFREVVLRRVHRRAVAAARLSQQLHTAVLKERGPEPRGKITLQRNEELVREIRTKSDAAKVLGIFPEAHEQVFELCEQYLSAASNEISLARPGSPRIPALRKGSKFAAARHRFHMLKWAELKARSLFEVASVSRDRVSAAEDALGAVERAIHFYPEEPALSESRSVLQVFLVSAKIKDSIEKAEFADAQGDRSGAADHYRGALADLQDCDIQFKEREVIYRKLELEIGRLSDLADV